MNSWQVAKFLNWALPKIDYWSKLRIFSKASLCFCQATVFQGSAVFLHGLHVFLFWTIFPRMSVWLTTLKDGVSFWRGEQVCILPRTINITSPEEAKVRQVFLLHVMTDSGFLSSDFLSCDVKVVCMKHLPRTLHITLVELGTRGDPYLLSNEYKVLCLWPRTLISCHHIKNCLVTSFKAHRVFFYLLVLSTVAFLKFT